MSNLTPGLHLYEAIEATGLDMSQVGFKIADVPHNQLGNAKLMDFRHDSGIDWQKGIYTNVPKKFGDGSNDWGPIGFYVVDQANVQARVATIDGVKKGDDFAKNGVFVHSTTNNANYVECVKGVFWGNFDQISIWKPPPVQTVYVKIIIGPRT